MTTNDLSPKSTETSVADQAKSQAAAPKNALLHGVYSEDIVLPFESKEEFNSLLEQYRGEFNPQGPFEDSIVGQITQLQWLKRRLQRCYTIPFLSDPIICELEAVAKKGATAIEEYIIEKYSPESTDRKEYKLSPEQFKMKIKQMEVERGLIPPDESEASQTPTKKESMKLAVDRMELEGLTVRAGDMILDRVFRPNALERFLKELGSIDARIEKAIARLVCTKEYKIRYGAKTIQA